jgi:hypothetical protein
LGATEAAPLKLTNGAEQIVVHDFFGGQLDIVHSHHPLHWTLRFQILANTLVANFDFGHA